MQETKKRFRVGDIAVALIIIAVVLLLLIPPSPDILDVLLILNIGLALTILLITIYTKETLEFSIFPSLLLIVTLFRLALTISSMRLILSNGGDAGNVIRTFGSFVAGGNLVIGVIIFFVLIIVQFIVITKGAERVAEVAARFTLDAMPGKQMAIDADLNSGLIDESTARERRLKIQREADFYGSMDGASKFVKGDAIAGIIVMLINAVGGLIIGMVMLGGTLEDAADLYILAAIGNGLCSQIPALLISTAMGMIVTKAASENNLSVDMITQMSRQPLVLMITGSVMIVMALIPGMPAFAMVIMGAGLIVIGAMQRRTVKKTDVEIETEMVEQYAEETRKPESVVSLLQVDPIELVVGYALIPLADPSQGGDLSDRLIMIRRQCAIELGMIVPLISIHDNIRFAASEYVIKIKGNEVAHGEVIIDHYLAMNPGDIAEMLDGIETTEPAFGLPATWITERQRERAELLGFTIVDPPSVIATHMTEVIRRSASELLGRQQVQVLVDNLRQSQPALVDEVVPKLFSLGEVQKVLANLLREGVSIRDMGTVLETLGDYGTITRDHDMLTEYVRQALKRTITKKFVPDARARVLTLDPALEQTLLESVRQTEHGSYISLEADVIQKILIALRDSVEHMTSIGITPLVLTSPVVRYHFKKLVENIAPDLVVLSYNELENDVDIQADGVVAI